MAGENTATTPAAPAIDYTALAAALAPALAAANKPLIEQIQKLSTPQSPATPAPAAAATTSSAPLTAADVQRIVADGLKSFSTTQQASAARDSFIQSKMSDLPATYRNLLPQTGDAGELAAAEQKIRQQYQADFKAAGGTTPAVQGATGATTATPPGAAVDLSKLDSVSKIALGLKQDATPVRQQPPSQGQGTQASAAS